MNRIIQLPHMPDGPNVPGLLFQTKPKISQISINTQNTIENVIFLSFVQRRDMRARYHHIAGRP